MRSAVQKVFTFYERASQEGTEGDNPVTATKSFELRPKLRRERQVRKIVISGGPCTGKTTLLEHLGKEFPEAHFVPEPATVVIERELAKQEQDPDYPPIVPWNADYENFGREVTEESLRLEEAIPESTDLVFQDRSIIDSIGYARYYRTHHIIDDLERHAKAAGYAMALFCEQLDVYMQTDLRKEDIQEANQIHQHLSVAYRESGLAMVNLRPVPVTERVEDVKRAIQKY